MFTNQTMDRVWAQGGLRGIIGMTAQVVPPLRFVVKTSTARRVDLLSTHVYTIYNLDYIY